MKKVAKKVIKKTFKKELKNISKKETAFDFSNFATKTDTNKISKDLGGLKVEVNKISKDLNNLEGEVNKIGKDLNNLEGEVNKISKDVKNLEKKIDEKFADNDKKLVKIDKRFDKMDKKFEAMVETVLNSVGALLKEQKDWIDKRFEIQEDRIRVWGEMYKENRDEMKSARSDNMIIEKKVDISESRIEKVEESVIILNKRVEVLEK